MGKPLEPLPVFWISQKHVPPIGSSSATQSPPGLLSLTALSVNAYSPRGLASIFAIGPYAHETQLVTPPVFSALATEPSNAPFTPPPESVQLTTPSSPEVQFAQLLTSSLERARRNSGINQKFGLSHYEFQPYQIYPGSPGGNLISPGSAISNSGTSSPFPDRCPILEFHRGAPKIVGFEHFTTCKWGSRLGSGSLTPDGLGLGSGSLTPDGFGPASRDGFLVESQISEVALLADPANGPKNEEIIVDHRVSFELSGEDVAQSGKQVIGIKETSNETVEKASGEAEEEHCYRKHRSVTLGSIKEFNFDNTKGEASDKPTIRSERWANEKVAGKEARPGNNWTFFPMLKPEVR
ncbi:hypothetical protein CRYUN_Cryun07bG0105700 [Craigia yunnanensis]